ncbi:hypothetical protein BV22DRAFT_1135801 [Leucogyrophana mollusca]|uniref:Uncharacterized protein n=1 Tax=Leucogyrophana mollusca TaxID=85980 RepID=A0ACB8AU31_9AGAM|nr:hypothetical protein BV22DRAFT_1135801 [Leucogyrophana mollusca]
MFSEQPSKSESDSPGSSYYSAMHSQLSSCTTSPFAVRHLEQHWSSSIDDLPPIPIPFALETFLLAKKFKLPSVLKRAFYELLRTSGLGLDVLDLGVPYEAEFTRQDFTLLVRTREKLDATWTKVTIVQPQPPDMDLWTCCMSRETQRAFWDSAVFESGLQIRFLHDPICGLMELEHMGLPYCDRCVVAKRRGWEEVRISLWSYLDEVLAPVVAH